MKIADEIIKRYDDIFIALAIGLVLAVSVIVVDMVNVSLSESIEMVNECEEAGMLPKYVIEFNRIVDVQCWPKDSE